GTYTIGLTITYNGCVLSETTTVTVAQPLTPPVINCNYSTQDSVIFGWDPVPGATGYTVSVISGPMGTLSGTTYTMSGLTIGQMVSIQVTALGGGTCGPAVSTITECQALACPPVTISVDNAAQSFCNDGNNAPVALTATVMGDMGTGTLTWNGPGVTGASFDADDAGVGVHTITARYTEDGCPFTATVQFTVFALPTGDFTFAPDEICVNGTTTVTYAGSGGAGATYAWNFGSATVVSGSDAGPYELQYDAAGTFPVSLTVTENGCPGPAFTADVTVADSLAVPVPFCQNTGLDQVTFAWNVPAGADGVEVTVIAGPTGVRSGNTYTVTGLNEGDEVTIEVFATGSGVCGNSNTAQVTCQAQSCDPVVVTIEQPAQDVCVDAAVIDLSATATGGAGGGTYVWSGDGVTGTQFDPAVAGLGPHTITVNYTEGACNYSQTVDFTVLPLPTADFSLDLMTACVGDDVTATYTGSAGAGATYAWDFGDGGTATPGTGAGPQQITWSTPGVKTVSLTVTEN
ncbi:MAG: PKD domain-containing protein, partial [Saprospiraceae bacterium]